MRTYRRFGKKVMIAKYYHAIASLQDEYKRFMTEHRDFTIDDESVLLDCINKIREASDKIATDYPHYKA